MRSVCKYHLEGKCRKGAKCRKSHDTSPPGDDECQKCKSKTPLDSRKLCQGCAWKTCVLCLDNKISHNYTTCRPCLSEICPECKVKRKLSESNYCSDCALFCKGCNPSTPFGFKGPLCKNCQEWCSRCILEEKKRVPKYPGEDYCEKCLKYLCCGHPGFSRHVYCLTCRIPKKCSIPCCNKTVLGKESAPCSDCQGIHDGLIENTLKPEEISTKYSVRVRYDQLIEEHDGYCSGHYDDVDYYQILDVWMPLPSMLDEVADSCMTDWHGEEEEKEEKEEKRIHYSEYDSSVFESRFKTEVVPGPNAGVRLGPDLAYGYYFYSLEQGCRHGSGYCNRGTHYTPLFIEILRL